jgi:predicted esterase
LDPKLNYPIPHGVHKHSIAVEKTARWFHIGIPPQTCSHIIVILHGYGQHPAYLLGGMNDLVNESDSLCISAPEGLSRFYVKGFEGKVGASWMTRDERQQDITDQISYLDNWWESLNIPSETRVTLVGFSQGVATACRWIAASKIFEPSTVIFHSGTIPPEWIKSSPSFSKEKTDFVLIRGDIDPVFSEEAHSEAATFLTSLGLNVETSKVQGSHKMTAEHLAPYL